ncbi:MAG: hypothetical protein ABFS46_22120, partial [Myxococcota bacterium]
MTQASRAGGGLLALLLVTTCSPGDPAPPEAPPEAEAREPSLETPDLLDGRALPPHARPEIVAEFREAEQLRLAPSDGQGTANVEPADAVPAGSFGAWRIRFVAGPEGIAPGGSLVLQVSPFWGWSDPQPFDDRYPGFTRVETDAPGTRLVADPCGQSCLRVGVEGEPLPGGGEILVHYGGAGPAEARVDRFAEDAEEFFLRVDGDGDGVAAPVPAPPSLDILAGAARA